MARDPHPAARGGLSHGHATGGLRSEGARRAAARSGADAPLWGWAQATRASLGGLCWRRALGGPLWRAPLSCLSADLHQPRQSLTAQGCWAAAQAVYYLVMMEWKASSQPADRWRRGDRWWWMVHMAGPERAQAAVSGMRLSHWRRPAVTCRCYPACQAASERQDAAGSAVVGLCGAAARLTCRNSSHEVHHA